MPERQVDRGAGWAGAGGGGGAGVDTAPEARPGVPMYAPEPRASEARMWTVPKPQAGAERHQRHEGLQRITPVFGTANPEHGVAGLLRRTAYGFPEDLARHWLLLLMADRVDVVEDRLGGLLAWPLEAARLPRLGRAVHRNPLVVLGVAVVGGWMAR